MNTLIELFKKYRSIGVVGNINVAKSSLVLSELVDLRKKVDIPVYVLGAEPNLYEYLESQNINILYSADDVLDLQIKNSIVFIDEFADIFDVKMSSKQTDRIKKFFNRIAHLNNYIIIGSAEVNFWNKFMCSLVKAHLVKTIEYVSLVRGTFLLRKVKNISENCNEYRLEAPINTYYIVTNDSLTQKRTFKYNEDLDSKKHLVNPFLKLDLKLETKLDSKPAKNLKQNLKKEIK